jgi:hypothetical protein
MVRYEWSLARATRNGYAGFVIFHGALAMIVASLLAREQAATRLVQASFVIVSVGAVGAVFRYDDVARYTVPVIVLAATGVIGLLLPLLPTGPTRRRDRRRQT